MRNFYVERIGIVTNLCLEDGVIFFRKTEKSGYTIEVIEEFSEYSEYIRSIIDKLSEDVAYDVFR